MQKFIDIIGKIERLLATIFMGGMTSLVIFDVISREVFNQGLPWAQKTAVYLMIWGGFLGAIIVSEKGAHLRPEIGDKLWSKFPHGFVRVQNLVSVVFCFFFVYASISYVAESMEFGDKSVVLKVPLWTLQAIIPYTFFSMGLRNIFYLIYPQKQLELDKELH